MTDDYIENWIWKKTAEDSSIWWRLRRDCHKPLNKQITEEKEVLITNVDHFLK